MVKSVEVQVQGQDAVPEIASAVSQVKGRSILGFSAGKLEKSLKGARYLAAEGVQKFTGGGYGVEFVTLDGQTIAVLSLHADQVRQGGAGEIHHARSLETRM